MGSTHQQEPDNFIVSRKTRSLLIEQAREMRSHPTKPEALLWGELRMRQLAGYRFRRQHPIGSFIVDFYCPQRKLVVEVDGPIHLKDQSYDATRKNYFQSMGCTVLRFTNQQVEEHLCDVLKEILLRLNEIT